MKINDITLIPPSCLSIKCVYGARVISSIGLALQLLVLEEMSVLKLRSMGKIDKELARKLPIYLRKAVFNSVERSVTGDISSAVNFSIPELDKKIKKYVISRFDEVASHPLDYILSVLKRKPNIIKTGWRIINDPLNSFGIFVIPKKYFWYTVEYLTRVNVSFRSEIVFCNNSECYPLPLGMYPSTLLTGVAYDSGDIDKILYLEKEYGGANISAVLSKLENEIKDVGLAIYPKKNKSVASFFLKVDKPREIATKLAQMQLEALRIEDEILRKVLGRGYDIIYTGTTSLEQAIREALQNSD